MDFLMGLVVGAICTAPTVFLFTNWAAEKSWRCRPCIDGKPAKQPVHLASERLDTPLGKALLEFMEQD